MTPNLTVDGYEFEHNPVNYRKIFEASNNSQTFYKRKLADYYQSDAQQLVFSCNGQLSVNQPSDVDELSKLKEKAKTGGEVLVEFDPFFSGRCVIVDNPFTVSNGDQAATYNFSFAVNEELTDPSDFPQHEVPTKGSGTTFKLGGWEFGYDPDSVNDKYDRQTQQVRRLQGLTQTTDNEGLLPTVTLEGLTDGGGQWELWDSAKKNLITYLNSEFQSGWVIINSLTVQNDPSTPQRTKGLFRYSIDFSVVKGADTSGTQTKIDEEVKDSGFYTSGSDDGTIQSSDGLQLTVNGGTGAIDGQYVSWGTQTVSLTDNATNYVYLTDSNNDSQGTVETSTSGFPSGSLPLHEVTTSKGSVSSTTDKRDILTREVEVDQDLVFQDSLGINDDGLDWYHAKTLTDETVPTPSISKEYTGITDLQDTVPTPTGVTDFTGRKELSDETFLNDGTSTAPETLKTSADLSGGSITVVVYNDRGDQSDPITLDGSGNYDITGLNSGKEFYAEVTVKGDNKESTAELNSISLEGGSGGELQPRLRITPGVYERSGNIYEGGRKEVRYE